MPKKPSTNFQLAVNEATEFPENSTEIALIASKYGVDFDWLNSEVCWAHYYASIAEIEISYLTTEYLEDLYFRSSPFSAKLRKSSNAK